METRNLRDRYRCLDLVVLAEILGLDTLHSLRDSRLIWIDAAIKQNQLDRNPIWIETVADGNKEYMGYMHSSLKIQNPRRSVVAGLDAWYVKETRAQLEGVYGTKN